MNPRTKVQRTNNRQRGTSLIEVVISCMISALIAFASTNFLLSSMKVAQRVDSASSSGTKSSISIDKLMNDLQSGDAFLSQWPPTGTPRFLAGANGALIIRIPRYDSNQVQIPNEFDIAIYSLTDSTNPNKPDSLDRFRSTLVDGQPGGVTMDTSVATSIKRWTTTYVNTEKFISDGSRTQYTLSANRNPSSPVIVNEVWNLGSERVSASQATITNNQLSLGFSPPADSEVEARYSINSTTGQVGGVLTSNSVVIDINYEFESRTKSASSIETRTMRTGGALRNR